MTKRKRKYPKSPVITTRNQAVRAAFYNKTDAEAPLGPGQIVAGYIQHPDTSLWQVWLSTNGYDFTQIAAFKDQSKAAGAVEIIKKEGREGNLANQQLVDALFAFLAEQSDGQAKPLPDELVRKLARELRHHVIKDEEEKAINE